MTPFRQKYIVHVDMDAFFASVEQRDYPTLKGKPVIIGADPKDGQGRGVVSTCSYEAREYNVHSALPISTAYKRCPHGIFLRGDMKKYARVSHEIFSIMETFTPDIAPISIDEAFMDITGSWPIFGSPKETCSKIKKAIKDGTGLTASLGMAPNMMTAKIASDLEKPDGLVIVKPTELIDFLHPLPIRKLWGIGPKTAETLRRIGISTIGDLASRDRKHIERHFGKHGIHAWTLANGIDPRKVKNSQGAVSVSNEHTFAKDTSETTVIRNTLMRLSEKVSRRLRQEELAGRTITLKIRFSNFRTYTRSSTIDKPTNFTDEIYRIASGKINEFDLAGKRVRLLGIKVSNFTMSSEDDLFDGEHELSSIKKENIHKALDKIIDKYGSGAIRRRK